MPYLIESNRKIREVAVEQDDGEFALVHFTDSGCRLLVRSKRIFSTEKEAEAVLPYKKKDRTAAPGGVSACPWSYA